jgi:diacylglycerol kinase family enzyme
MEVVLEEKYNLFIQVDGELIETNSFKVEVLPNAFSFVVK